MKRVYFILATLLVAAICWAGSGSDSFTRANANPLDGSWGSGVWGVEAQIVSNNVRPASCGSSEVIVPFTAFTPTNNQTAGIKTVAFEPSVRSLIGVALRVTTAYYGFIALNNDGGGLTSEIYMYNGGYSVLASESATSWGATDVINGLADGTTLTLKKNTTQILQTTDNTLTSGSLGLNIQCNNGGTETNLQADDFTASDISPPAATVTRRRPIIIQ